MDIVRLDLKTEISLERVQRSKDAPIYPIGHNPTGKNEEDFFDSFLDYIENEPDESLFKFWESLKEYDEIGPRISDLIGDGVLVDVDTERPSSYTEDDLIIK